MAWRIDEQIIRGEIDNRISGTVTGRLWFEGREDPVELDLQGNPWRDLAGHVLRFRNPKSRPGETDGLAARQEGVVGDMTASRKVKVTLCSIEERMARTKRGESFPWKWSNCLYLEWFSQRNGRVVIESVDFELVLDDIAAWSMTETEEEKQKQINGEAITQFIEGLGAALQPNEFEAILEEENEPQGRMEAQAQEEAARMDLLLERVTARLEKEGDDGSRFEQILTEERERLRVERGEPEPDPLNPEEEAERAAWIEAAQAAALDDDEYEPIDHPLAGTCSDLGIRLYHEIEAHAWLDVDASAEHPISEVVNGVEAAGVKLTGALNGRGDNEDWPPNPIFAGDTLVRLKNARGYLRDALVGLTACDEERLADSDWRGRTRFEINAILSEVKRLIEDVRSVLD